MAGAIGIRLITDAEGNDFPQRVWDESGSGAGPFLPIGYGDAPVNLATPRSRDATIATSQVFLDPNPDRKSVGCHNRTNQNAYVRASADDATTDADGYDFFIAAGDTWEMPFRYLGAMTFIMEAAADAGGTLNVSERT